MEGLRQLLSKFQKGNISIDEMISRLSVLPYENLEFAKVDHHRAQQLSKLSQLLNRWLNIRINCWRRV